MTNTIYMLLTIAALAITSMPAQGQAWERNTKALSLTIGASRFYHIDNYHHRDRGNRRNWYNPVTGQLNFSGEFGIHKYVGLGFTTGFGGRGGWSGDYLGEINFPIGMLANFHFYQLIADNTSRNIRADKLDIYAGVDVGSGVAVAFYDNATRVAPIAFGNLHAGIRYYFKPGVGVTAEMGWGRHIVNVGFVFKR